ncbi:MAG: bifunctional pyr operon transcriptional regulator/uracil phosphoribosyltransferase PyrR [Ottowia sp.]|nr:bifunctional pyr operon transcriptional regulator/uracil phosphoribosyltransferase PyrR [Ottowia sp.]
MSGQVPDAEAVYREFTPVVQALLGPRTELVGIVTGGWWLAQRLHADLALTRRAGALSSAMHRDDFARRGLTARGGTELPFDVDGADILLVDDILHTGRTIRAAVNELFDYGRPARIRLAVLVDRNGRELPIAAQHAQVRLALPAARSLQLGRNEDGRFEFHLEAAG